MSGTAITGVRIRQEYFIEMESNMLLWNKEFILQIIDLFLTISVIVWSFGSYLDCQSMAGSDQTLIWLEKVSWLSSTFISACKKQ